MAKSKSKPTPQPEPLAAIDATSPEIVLEYLGGATPRHVPARDLTGNDVARIHYHRATALDRRSRSLLVQSGEPRKKPTRPGSATQEALEELASELVVAGRFSRNAPTVSAPPTDEPDAPPAEPAPQPEA